MPPPSPAVPRAKAWRRHWRYWLAGILAILLLGSLGLIWLAKALTMRAAKDALHHDLASVPQRRVALILGANEYSPYLRERLVAGAALYHAGKVTQFLVSGDNHHESYDEPTAMMEGLVMLGVPAQAITRDFAGFRTLDSVIRAKAIFGVNDPVIVSQPDHVARALLIARYHGLTATGYGAAYPASHGQPYYNRREALARVAAMLDLYLLRRQPRFLGPYEPISEPPGPASDP